MKPPPRTEARSPALLPWISSVLAHTSPTKPVKTLITVTSRFSSRIGSFDEAAASPAGASSAARAWPTSQYPVHQQDGADVQQHHGEQHGPLLASSGPAVMVSADAGASGERDHGRAPPAPGRRQRRDDLRLRAALLGVIDRRDEARAGASEHRRGEDPPRVAAAHGHAVDAGWAPSGRSSSNTPSRSQRYS
jgi:hypothetical protein